VAGIAYKKSIAKPPRLAAIRKIALGFPEAWENEWHGNPWFQIGKSSFALYSSKDRCWIFKLPMAQQMMLFDTRPETFRVMIAGKLRWSFVQVENLDAAELRDLLEAAWRVVAPKKLQTGKWARP
jgi:hypothetical protein